MKKNLILVLFLLAACTKKEEVKAPTPEKKQAEIAQHEQTGRMLFEENAKNLKVTRVGDQMQFIVDKEGAGEVAHFQDLVTIEARGFLLDGTKFLDTYEKKKPVVEKVVNLGMPGWRTMIQQMKEGSKYTVWMAPQSAYGMEGGERVPPQSYVKFELELIKIVRNK